MNHDHRENWLVVSTHLKNISQIGNIPQIGVQIENIWNHHLENGGKTLGMVPFNNQPPWYTWQILGVYWVPIPQRGSWIILVLEMGSVGIIYAYKAMTILGI